MSYEADVYNVMIASPGDVASERAIIRDVIYEWNAVHSNARKIVLLPIGWESNSSPEMGASAQAIINTQILDKGDLLIGVFWTRIGTATEDYASGTVEEIERHISSGKPAMLYFSSQPVSLDSVDAAQYSKLKEFRESCKPRGLLETYDSHSDFKDKFYRNLQIKINDHPLFAKSTLATAPSTEVLESKTKLPTLSNEAKVLLKEASMDHHGTIFLSRTLTGVDIQTNDKNLNSSVERREIAKWEHAIQELLDERLIVSRGQKDVIFEITNLGYQIADMIAL